MKKTNKNLKKGLYTTTVLAAMILTPYIADEVSQTDGTNIFENKASALEGKGIYGNPYIVNDVAELEEAMKNATDKDNPRHVQINADIDLTGVYWTPIGTSSKPAYIYIDGQGHTIKGFQVNKSSDYQGFIGYMKDSMVENVIFESPRVIGGSYVGVVAGKAVGSSFKHVKITNPEVHANSKYAGGIVGAGATGTSLTSTYVVGGDIYASTGYAGGIVGDYSVSASNDIVVLRDLYANTAVRSAGNYVGGLFGELSNSSSSLNQDIIGAIAEGTVIGTTYVGGIAGKTSRVDMTGAATYNSVEGTKSSGYVGGITGQLTGSTSIKGFAFNSSISGIGSNIGIVFGSTSTSDNKTSKQVTAGKKWEGTSFNTYFVSGYKDATTMEDYFYVSKTLNYYNAGYFNGFQFTYFDVKTKKVMPIYLASNADLLYSFSSSEYQNAFKTIKADALNKLNQDVQDSAALLSPTTSEKYLTNTLLNYDNAYETLVGAMDTAANKQKMETLISEITASQALIEVMYRGWSTTTGNLKIPTWVFKNQELGSAYLNSTQGQAFVEKILANYATGSFGTYGNEKIAMIDAFNALRVAPNQTTYNNFMGAAKLDSVKTTSSSSNLGNQYLTAIADFYKKKYNLADYVDMSYQNAVNAVIKAEATPNDQNLTDARSKVLLVIDTTEKKNLTTRLDAVEAIVEAINAVNAATTAVELAESSQLQADVKSALTLVKKLPTGDEKTNLTARLDVVQAAIDLTTQITKATTAVEKAETSKTTTYVSSARKLVDALPDGEVKTSLSNRLDIVQADIDLATQVKKATSAVSSAESYKKQSYVDTARPLVDALPDIEDKANLTTRLDAVQKTIDDAANLAAAKTAVTKAEGSKLQADVNDARSIVNILSDGTDKTNLTTRLDKVQKAIDDATNLAVAKDAVTKAEGSQSESDVNDARTLVNLLPTGTDKTNLTTCLDKVQKTIDDAKAAQEALDKAKVAVKNAEGSKAQSELDTARTLVNALPIGEDKDNLTKRLDVVEQAIADAKAEAEKQQAIQNATNEVVKAEGTKAQADVDNARTVVNALQDGAEKTTLNTRLDNVQKGIDDAKAEAEKQQAIQNATNEVVKAEGTKAQADVDNARTVVNALQDGAEKTTLNTRLDAVQKAIDEEVEKAKAIKGATDAVIKAEGSKAQSDVDDARTVVNALPNGEEKTSLTQRLDNVQKAIDDEKVEAEKAKAIEDATKSVKHAEGSKAQSDVDDARTIVNALPDGKEKTALNERLDNVQKGIDDAKAEAAKQQAIQNATNEVVKAETSKVQEDVDNARNVVNALPDGEEKANLAKRLDDVQKVINDAKSEAEKQKAEAEKAKAIADATNEVVKAEDTKAQVDIDNARSLVNNLPDGDEKTALNERLDSVEKAIADAKAEEEKQKAEAEKAKAIEAATKSVEKAEDTKSQDDVDNARQLVNGLPNGKEKSNLTKRLSTIEKEIEKAKEGLENQKAIDDATKAVVKAETSKAQTDVNQARKLVDKLPHGKEKTDFTKRLNAIEKAINNDKEEVKNQKAIDEAIKSVEKAEKHKDARSVYNAKVDVNKLKDGEVKDALNARIKAVEDEIENAELFKTAEKAVARAEKSRSAKDINDALAQVNKMKDGSSKEELMKRVNAIEEYDSQYEAAKKLVEMMEKNPNAKNINVAEKAVEKVKSEVRKADLQARIDAVNDKLNEKAVEEATKFVVEAEKTKTSISVINAQKAVDELSPSVEKDALQERVNAVKKDIQKTNEDLSKFVVDEEVLKAIDEIKDKKDRKALKDWKEAIERGEKYFSNNMVRSIEKAVPSDAILNNEEYALIVAQLQARSASLIQGGQEYSYLYQLKIRDAYDAVLKFEAKPDKKHKATALKAVDIVNKSGNVDNVFVTVLKARVTNIKF